MKYIRKPIIIIPTIILLFLGGVIMWFGNGMVFKNYSLGIVLIIASIILMMVSFIDALISKKWLKGFLYFVFYGLLLLLPFIYMLMVLMVGAATPTTKTTKYYNDRLNYHLESSEPIELATLCKDDEVYESFTGDLNASCIFKLSNKEYEDLIFKIEDNKNFEKLNIKDFYGRINLNELECSRGITFKNDGYQSFQNSGLFARIIFSTDNEYCLFNLDYN